MPPSSSVAPLEIERLDDVGDPGQLLLVDDRAELHVLAERVARAQALGLLGERRRVRLGQVAVDEVTAGREADLALELERREGTGRGRRVEVGIVEDDERVVAAELERDLLEHAAGQHADAAPDRRGAGERDDRDIRVCHEGLADIRPTDHDLEQSLGQPRLGEDRREHRAADDGCLGVGLEHDRVAEGEGRRDHAHAQHAR